MICPGSSSPQRPSRRTRRPRLTGLLTTLIACLTAALALAGPAAAGVANGGLAGPDHADPIAGLRWGNYTGSQDEVFPAYRAAAGRERQLLGQIALRPRMRWFGGWYSDAQIQQTIQTYLANVTGGDPNVLAQVAVFRVHPWEHAACSQLPTAAQIASYRDWIESMAAGIGSARVAMVLQPDLPFGLCTPHHSMLPLKLVAEAARTFNALPHTTVYIDAGAADWPTVGQAVRLLRTAGVAGVRGFALNATHYDSTGNELQFGAKVVAALARAHIGGKHFVINTASNGRPFTYQQYHGPNFDNAATCAGRGSRRCVTLGIPPTWQTSATRWHLSAHDRALAARYADAYLWYGRPWLDNQADPFDLQRSLQLAATTPF